MDKLKDLTKNPKMLVYVGGGAVILFLLYRYFAGRSSSGSPQTQPTPDQTGLTAAEQVGAQEAGDVSQLQSDLGVLQGAVDDLTGQIQGLVDGAGAGASPVGPAPGVPEVVTGDKKKHRPPNDHPGDKNKKPRRPGAPKPDHPKGHQSNRKHGGSGAVAPSLHHKPKPKTTGGLLQLVPGPAPAPKAPRTGPIRVAKRGGKKK